MPHWSTVVLGLALCFGLCAAYTVYQVDQACKQAGYTYGSVTLGERSCHLVIQYRVPFAQAVLQ